MRKPIVLLAALLTMGLLLNSCSKEAIVDQANDTAEMVNTASDYASAETAFEDIFKLVDEEAQQEGDLNGFISSGADDRECGAVTVSRTLPGIFPLTLTIDFTDGNCQLSDGRTVSGTITTVFTGLVREAGSAYTISLDNFILDGNTISGTKTITNNGLNAAGQLSYTSTVVDGSVLFANGQTLSYETTRTRTWIEGMDTDFQTSGAAGLTDDVWEITGTASGLNREGNTYEVNVTTALRRDMDCRWLTAGILEIETDVFDRTIVIDYGTGMCDDKVTATLGLIQREITMK